MGISPLLLLLINPNYRNLDVLLVPFVRRPRKFLYLDGIRFPTVKHNIGEQLILVTIIAFFQKDNRTAIDVLKETRVRFVESYIPELLYILISPA